MATTTKTNGADHIMHLADRIAFRLPDAPPGVHPSRAQLAAVAAEIAESFRPERIAMDARSLLRAALGLTTT